MAQYIVTGSDTAAAMKGMIARPSDREKAASAFCVSCAVATDALRMHCADTTEFRQALGPRVLTPPKQFGSPSQTQKNRPLTVAVAQFGLRPASPCQGIVTRVVHKISTRKINDLSPENSHAAALFACATQVLLRPFLYRNGSQDTGWGARASG